MLCSACATAGRPSAFSGTNSASACGAAPPMTAREALHGGLRLARADNARSRRRECPAAPPPAEPRLGHAAVGASPGSAPPWSGGLARPRRRRCGRPPPEPGSSGDRRPGVATLASVEKAMTGLPRLPRHLPGRLHGACKERADDEFSALRHSLARGACAPSGVPRSSFTRTVISGFWISRERQFGGVAHALRQPRRPAPARSRAGSGRPYGPVRCRSSAARGAAEPARTGGWPAAASGCACPTARRQSSWLPRPDAAGRSSAPATTRAPAGTALQGRAAAIETMAPSPTPFGNSHLQVTAKLDRKK